jgi:hypothetical protein
MRIHPNQGWSSTVRLIVGTGDPGTSAVISQEQRNAMTRFPCRPNAGRRISANRCTQACSQMAPSKMRIKRITRMTTTMFMGHRYPPEDTVRRRLQAIRW